MATVSDENYESIICNHIKPFPDTNRRFRFLVAIPMWLWRVETCVFTHGLNFFQKAVLKLKACPKVKDAEIASFLGLDERLVAIVRGQLERDRYLDRTGFVTEAGKIRLADADGLTVDGSRRKTGYVFQYTRSGDFHPFYVDRITRAETHRYDNSPFPSIVTGEKGDGADYTETAFYIKDLWLPDRVQAMPDAREIVGLIENSNRKARHIEDSKYDPMTLTQLGVRILSERAELRWVVTWVSLPKRDDAEDGETYCPDWRVRDPFGFGDTNAFLKAELANVENRAFLNEIDRRFGDAVSIGRKNVAAYKEQMDEAVDVELETFAGLNMADSRLRDYVRGLAGAFVRLREVEAETGDGADTLTLNAQKIIEYVLLQDQKRYAALYERLYEGCELPNKELWDVFYTRKRFTSKTGTPPKDLNFIAEMAAKGKGRGTLRGSSLTSYLLAFILTTKYNEGNPLIPLFKDRIEGVLEIKRLRNACAHAEKPDGTSREVTPEKLKEHYVFIKHFVNDYSAINRRHP
jgi:hypothetical protein